MYYAIATKWNTKKCRPVGKRFSSLTAAVKYAEEIKPAYHVDVFYKDFQKTVFCGSNT